MKTLIVYYSRTGKTRMVAHKLSSMLGCDIEEITDKEDRSGPIGFLRSGRQARDKELIDINDLSKDPASYDMIIIGTPVWAWTMASPVRSFIHKYRDRFNKVAIFCTCGSVGADSAMSEIEVLSGKKALSFLGLKNAELKEDLCGQKLKGFVEEIKNK
ncbi:flavodoxin family protein [Methanooceanicella nereidis]|uniref:flavodoxin family protein n=1 Tax=Methanooceanicella nereidis TaxID=2052831 RepID=UPI001E307FCC